MARSRRDDLRVMMTTLAVTAIGVVLIGVRAHASDRPAGVGDPARGRELFLSGCSSCHGPRGEGVVTSDGERRGPSIVDSGEAGAYFQLATGRMPLGNSLITPVSKRPAYDAADISALVAYVGSLGNGPPMPEIDVAEADLARGAELYLANCAACHTASGAGAALSYGRAAPKLSEAEPLEVATAVRSGPGEMPVFDPALLDQADMNAVTSYVQYLRDPDDRGGLPIGRIGPVPEGLVALTFGIGSFIAAVVMVGTRSPIAATRDERPDD